MTSLVVFSAVPTLFTGDGEVDSGANRAGSSHRRCAPTAGASGAIPGPK